MRGVAGCHDTSNILVSWPSKTGMDQTGSPFTQKEEVTLRPQHRAISAALPNRHHGIANEHTVRKAVTLPVEGKRS